MSIISRPGGARAIAWVTIGMAVAGNALFLGGLLLRIFDRIGGWA